MTVVSRSRLPRVVTWVALAGLVLSLLGGVVARWPQLVRYYHLTELRDAPERLEEYLLSEDEARRDAARSFVGEEPGQRALFDLYIEEYDRTRYEAHVFDLLVRQPRNDDRLAGGILALWDSGYIHQWRTVARPVARGGSMGLEAENLRRRQLVLELLDACVGKTYRVKELPGFELQVQPLVDGQPLPPRWPPGVPGARLTEQEDTIWSDQRTGMRHVCFFRIVGN